MGGAPFPSLIGELQRRHCFRRGMLRNAARARFTPTPGVATPLSHATPSPAVARRPSSSAVTVARRPLCRLFLLSIYLCRAVPSGFFAPRRGFGARRRGSRSSKCISLRRTGRPTSRCNQTPAQEGRRGREERAET